MYKWLGNKVSGIPEISELSMSTSIDFVFSLILGKWWYNNPELLFGTLMDLANLGSNIGLKASVEISGFYCHSDFAWNQYWRI